MAEYTDWQMNGWLVSMEKISGGNLVVKNTEPSVACIQRYADGLKLVPFGWRKDKRTGR